MTTLTVTPNETATSADVDIAWNVMAYVVELTAHIGRDVVTDVEIDARGPAVRLHLDAECADVWDVATVINPDRQHSMGLWFEPDTGDLYRVGYNLTPTGTLVYLFGLADDDDARHLPDDADQPDHIYFL